MKTIYKSIVFTAIAFSVAVQSNAQTAKNDSTLNRQILLERDFDPTVQDASKINTLPAVHEPVVKQANVTYENRQPALTFSSYPLGDTGSGDISTGVDFSNKIGYLDFAAGSYSNIIGNLGVRALDTKTDRLDIFAKYNSTDGDIKYADKDYDVDKRKAKYMNILAKARYQHTFEFLKWHLAAKYENTAFNYYGNPFNNYSEGMFDFSKKQSVSSFGIETGISSTDNNEFIYNGSISYDHFSNKYGAAFSDNYGGSSYSGEIGDGFSGNLIDAKLDMAAPFAGNKLVGVRLGFLFEKYSGLDFFDEGYRDEFFHHYTRLQFNPYFGIEGVNYKVSLGVNVNYAIDNKNKFLIAPEVDVDWSVAENTSLYLGITGGVNDNNYLSIIQENRYISPTEKVFYSRTLADGTIGIKSGIVKGFEFDIFGGYKYTKGEHLYMALVDTYTPWSNVSTAGYFDLGTGHFGAQVKTSLIPRTDLSAKAVGYFYDASVDADGAGDLKAWNMPAFTLNLKADVHVLDNLTLSASYNLLSGRKGALVSVYNAGHGNELSYNDVSLKDINELNVSAEYRFTNWLTGFVQVNNLLNQKYDVCYGYTQQGLGVMGGVRLKF